jgi:glycosyltransferase involved in cell wall biosynthesis
VKVLFLYLKAFSFTGGIEKFNRSLLKALHELSVDGLIDADAISAYDIHTDEKYFPQLRFKGYGGGRERLLFVVIAFFKSFKYKTVILGHINLAVLGYWIKRINPSVRLIVVAHGIEVWKAHHSLKLKVLEVADSILAVSNFTKEQILSYNPTITPGKIRIFPNAIDPYTIIPTSFEKPEYLLKRYSLDRSTPVLLTVTRLAFSEKYKGYDKVIESMPALLGKHKNLKYLLCGMADQNEGIRIESLIERIHAAGSVKLLGFIKDSELLDHYLLADDFVMQSKKEGFGIVFIEALACGRKVIAGSKDGSSETLLNGQLGTLIDPDDSDQLVNAIEKALDNQNYNSLELQQRVIESFGFHRYKDRLSNYLVS